MSQSPARSALANRLRKARIKRKITRQKAAHALRVPHETIVALEEPGGSDIAMAHIQALSRRYAEYLGADNEQTNELIAQLQIGEVSFARRGRRRTDARLVASRVWVAGAVSLVVAVVLGYAGWQVYLLSAPPELAIAAPELVRTHTSDTSYLLQGSSEASATVTVNGSAILLDENGQFSVPVYLQQGYNRLDITATNSLDRSQTITREIMRLN